MRTSGIIFLLPFVLSIEHIYSELFISFSSRVKQIFSCCVLVISLVFSGVSWYFKINNACVYIELVIGAIGILIISKLLEKKQIKLSLNEFNRYELLVIIPQQLLGLLLIVVGVFELYSGFVFSDFNLADRALTRAMIIICGTTELICNRLIFFAIWRIIHRRN